MTFAIHIQKQNSELSKCDICVSCLNESGTNSSQVPVKDIFGQFVCRYITLDLKHFGFEWSKIT